MNTLSKLFIAIGVLIFVGMPIFVSNGGVQYVIAIFQGESKKFVKETIGKIISNKGLPDDQINNCKNIITNIDLKKDLSFDSVDRARLKSARNYCELSIQSFEGMNSILKIDALRLYKSPEINAAISEIEEYLTFIRSVPLRQSENIRGMTGYGFQKDILERGLISLDHGLEAQLELLKYQLSVQKHLGLNEDGTIYIENEKIREKYNSLAEKVQEEFRKSK